MPKEPPGKMKTDLLTAMEASRDCGEYLQRVYDCMFGGGIETDILRDLECVRQRAEGVVAFATMMEITAEAAGL
jgi:hypothetical protein